MTVLREEKLDNPLPVTLLSGFLGAGKTSTFLFFLVFFMCGRSRHLFFCYCCLLIVIFVPLQRLFFYYIYIIFQLF